MAERLTHAPHGTLRLLFAFGVGPAVKAPLLPFAMVPGFLPLANRGLPEMTGTPPDAGNQ